MLPREVFVRAGPEVTARRAGDLQIGDVVVIKPGARIPVDGLVVSGHSFVDQAAITGESLPVEKITGAGVYAGTINQAGTLEVEAARHRLRLAAAALRAAERPRHGLLRQLLFVGGVVLNGVVLVSLGAAFLVRLLSRSMRGVLRLVLAFRAI
jgi:Cd2+/Zn2+-exporting ATPase/Cu+-exporting ATPase